MLCIYSDKKLKRQIKNLIDRNKNKGKVTKIVTGVTIFVTLIRSKRKWTYKNVINKPVAFIPRSHALRGNAAWTLRVLFKPGRKASCLVFPREAWEHKKRSQVFLKNLASSKS